MLVTYYNGQFGLSLRHPATWRTEQAEQDGVWYRYFLGPPAGSKNNPAVSATLLVGKLNGSLDELTPATRRRPVALRLRRTHRPSSPSSSARRRRTDCTGVQRSGPKWNNHRDP